MNMSQYRDLFISESRGHIEAFSELIVLLEQSADDPGTVNELFRHAHSLKGMAATMQYSHVAELAHRMEDLLSRIRGGEFSFTPKTANILLEGNDLLAAMVSAIEADDDSGLPDGSGLVGRLLAYSPEENPATSSDGSAAEITTSPQHIQLRQPDSFKTVRIRTEVLDRFVNITGELITTRHQLADQLRNLAGSGLEEPMRRLSSLLRDLRDEVFLARMLPFSLIAERFPRLVRDLAHAQGKEVALNITGREIELDRGILEGIAEPLLHILRNAVDHGMEPSVERTASGKAPAGTISVTVERDRDHVNIAITDDGRGIDPVLLAALAVEKGLISGEQAAELTPHEALMLVCNPGFSTAEEVSEISGRGVGMDAVRNAVQRLGGTLAVESTAGKGSRFLLRLPLSVSIIHALLVECGKLTLAFPLNAVERTLELEPKAIFEEEGRESCRLDGITLPLKSLNRVLGQSLPKPGAPHIPVVVSRINGKAVGLVCDRITGQHEIFVRPLGSPLSRLRHCTGGAVMGNGGIIFVMDINSFC